MAQPALNRSIWTPGDLVRNHLRLLMDPAGVHLTVTGISKQSGVSKTTLTRILYGRKRDGLGPPARVAHTVAHKIFAVSPDQRNQNHLPPAGPVCVQIQGLMLTQYSLTDVAAGTTVSRVVLGRILWMHSETVLRSTATSIAKFHATHIDVPGPSPEARTQAIEMGFPVSPEQVQSHAQAIVGLTSATLARWQLRKLAHLRWSLDSVATGTDIETSTLSYIRDGTSAQVTKLNARRIDRFYREHISETGPSPRTATLALRLWPNTDGDWARHLLPRAPAGPTSNLLHDLTTRRFPLSQIAAEIATSAGELNRIMSGQRDFIDGTIAAGVALFAARHAGATGTGHLTAKYAARRPSTPEDRRRLSGRAPAAALSFMLQHLLYAGWPLTVIMAETGVTRLPLNLIHHGRQAYVSRSVAVKVKQFYVAHYDTEGPSQQIRTLARRSRYLPVWRVHPELVPVRFRTVARPTTEHLLEIQIRPWLLELYRHPNWGTSLPPSQRRSLETRFRLDRKVYGPIVSLGELASASGVSEQRLRAQTRVAILTLLTNSRVDLSDYETPLRRLMSLRIAS